MSDVRHETPRRIVPDSKRGDPMVGPPLMLLRFARQTGDRPAGPSLVWSAVATAPLRAVAYSGDYQSQKLREVHRRTSLR